MNEHEYLIQTTTNGNCIHIGSCDLLRNVGIFLLSRPIRDLSIILCHREWPVRMTQINVYMVTMEVTQSSTSTSLDFCLVWKFVTSTSIIFINFRCDWPFQEWTLIFKKIKFLSDGLFYRIVTRTTKWCIEGSGKEPYSLLKTQARFFLDDEHDFVIEMAPRKFHRIKVNTIIEVYF